MTLTRRYTKTSRISMWGSFLAVIVINTSLKNCYLASASKEEVDEQALSSMKSGRDMSSMSQSDLNSNPIGPSSFDGMTPWKLFPCYPPCLHSDYYPYGDNNLESEVEKRNFNPWGGKRSPSPLSEYFRQISELVKKNGGFNPWGGKRDPVSEANSRSSKNEYPSARRLPFNPWGGR